MLKPIRAWTGNCGSLRQGLVLAFTKAEAVDVVGEGRAAFEKHWNERRAPTVPLARKRLYTRPIDELVRIQDDLAWTLQPEPQRTSTMASTKPTVKRSKQMPKPKDRALGKYERASKASIYALTTSALASSSVIDAAVHYIDECNRVHSTPASEAKARLDLAAAVDRLEALHAMLGTFGAANARTIARMKRHSGHQ